MHRISLTLVLTFLLSTVTGCGDPGTNAGRSTADARNDTDAAPTSGVAGDSASANLRSQDLILATSVPLFEMAQRIAEDDLTVRYVTQVQSDPSDGKSSGEADPSRRSVSARRWNPEAADILAMQKARLILISGAGYEPWLDRVSLPRSRVNDTTKNIRQSLIEIPDAIVHRHGPEGDHSHSGMVWPVWLDPALAESQLDRVRDQLERVVPGRKSEFTRRAALLKSELVGLETTIQRLKAKKVPEQFTLLGDGPYYQYLLNRLGWNLRYVHWSEPEWPIVNSDREELQGIVRSTKAGIFLMRTERSKDVEEFAASSGLKVVRIDLCERPSSAGQSVFSRMEENLRRLEESIPHL
ncbi:MAG: metal ABC transporter substrate-binding protein [Planctomyces sp.]